MQYVFDTNILINMYDNYFPNVFDIVWNKVEELIDDGVMVSISEVKLELKSESIKNHWLTIESKCNETLFKELINGEEECIPLIESLPIYKEEFKRNKTVSSLEKEWGNYATVVADPWLIAYAWKHNAIVVTNEKPTKKHNIPHVCDELDVGHINLKEFFERNNIKF
ncbi:MAG: DUF4411 family protein [archaeon]|nr:DUF4411 family protein [archaeon]